MYIKALGFGSRMLGLRLRSTIDAPAGPGGQRHELEEHDDYRGCSVRKECLVRLALMQHVRFWRSMSRPLCCHFSKIA